MDPQAYLMRYGWSGPGNPLNPGGIRRGGLGLSSDSTSTYTYRPPPSHALTRPLLASRKQDRGGIGQPQRGRGHADQWWLRGFDAVLAGVGKGNAGKEQERKEEEEMVAASAVRPKSELYKNFVSAGILRGTLGEEEEKEKKRKEGEGGEKTGTKAKRMVESTEGKLENKLQGLKRKRDDGDEDDSSKKGKKTEKSDKSRKEKRRNKDKKIKDKDLDYNEKKPKKSDKAQRKEEKRNQRKEEKRRRKSEEKTQRKDEKRKQRKLEKHQFKDGDKDKGENKDGSFKSKHTEAKADKIQSKDERREQRRFEKSQLPAAKTQDISTKQKEGSDSGYASTTNGDDASFGDIETAKQSNEGRIQKKK